MGLGQGHGAEEAPVDHWLQEALFLLLGAEAFDQVGGAHGQERVGRRGGVGRLEVRETSLGQQGRQLHAACFKATCCVEEAGFKEGVHGGFDLGDQDRLAVFIARFVFVVLAVVRGEVLFCDVARRADRGIEGFAVVFGKPLALGQALGIEDFVQLESQIAGTEQRLGHGGVPLKELA